MLIEKLAAYHDRLDRTKWEGNFADYMEIVRQNPQVASLSHTRVFRMIEAAGHPPEVGQEQRDGLRLHNFFRGHLFGIDRSVAAFVDVIAAAARGLDTRKRIILLVGPVGSGKSTLAILLKKGLEKFSLTDEGAVYAIKGCAMHEEPLHLIPPSLRAEARQELGVRIEGDLCPQCQWNLEHLYHNDPFAVPVHRIIISEQNRVGIGTYVPSDPKSMDIADLVGGLDLAAVAKYGNEGDPRVWNFNGALEAANRGLFEGVEMLKMPVEFIYTFLTLSQESTIKTGRFALLYADEVIIAHTNETEFNAFTAQKKNEALHDRMIIVKIPYNLIASEEVKIYQSMLACPGLDCHIAPHALEVAAQFAVLSRLKVSKKKNVTLITKMKLYDSQHVQDFTVNDTRELQREFPDEGMTGISPRHVIDCISGAIVKHGAKCISPIQVLLEEKEAIEKGAHVDTGQEKEKLLGYIADSRALYDEAVKKELQKAFVHSFEDTAQQLFNTYLDHIQSYCEKTRLRDAVTGEDLEPDEKLMRGLETHLGISDSSARNFRDEILRKIGIASRRGEVFKWDSHPALKEAIEKKLFEDNRSVIRTTVSVINPDPEQKKRIDMVTDALIAQGYCRICAQELLKYGAQLLLR
ncbi:MAG TPA: protein prkA [Spirochaetia bacterium]|nr:protein prkA [Spirochaetia bacterium]